MSNKIIFIQEGEENPCLGCTNDCKYPCEAKQKWVLGGGIKGPKKNYKRAEAVERMAKGIFTEIWGLPNNRFNLAKSSVRIRNRKLAQAALDALINSQDNDHVDDQKRITDGD